MNNKNKLTVERIDEIKAREIDFSDIPELTEEDFKRGSFRNFKPRKKQITTNIDVDNLAWLKEAGSGYQKRLNKVLRWARQNNCPISTF